MIISCKNTWEFIKIDFWLTFKNSLILTTLYFMVIPVIRGISNLDNIQSAQCLSQSVALIGVLIVVPVTQHELDRNIKEIICTKAWSYHKSVLLRLIGSFILLSFFIIGFALIMQVKNCIFPFWEYVLATILYAGFVGTTGLVFSLIGSNVVVGYLSALGYWMLCQLQVIRGTSVLYLFPVEIGNLQIQKLTTLVLILMILVVSIFPLVKQGE